MHPSINARSHPFPRGCTYGGFTVIKTICLIILFVFLAIANLCCLEYLLIQFLIVLIHLFPHSFSILQTFLYVYILHFYVYHFCEKRFLTPQILYQTYTREPCRK